jgi:nucleoside-diphosphate-sugar epimerase
VVLSQMGERVIPRVLAGKAMRVVGDPDVRHTWTFITDVARALITIGADERAWGRAWYAPSNAPLTQRQLIEALCAAAGVPTVEVGSIPPLALRTLGLFVPMIHELQETAYQFNRPFVMDSVAMQSTFGLMPTALDASLVETVAWYRSRPVVRH